MSEAPTTVRRGRPRNEKARETILDVAMEALLDHGVAAMNMDTVAAAAGVSKATIYRWWPSKETLAMDALYRKWESAPAAPDTGSLRDDLRNLLWPWTELIARRPYGRVIAGLLGQVVTDPEFALTYRARFLEQRRDHGRMILQQAIARGEIPARTRIETVLDMLYGPVYHRLMHGHAPLDHTFVDDIVDVVLDGLRPRTNQHPRHETTNPERPQGDTR
ncbi:TetR/AcrR family transcriptional regulator [Nocardia sp. CA2R105]|uniref:TetR/AcrR family transcriptional regulator n=1 Tax=Nocardia coffeae TaxID=2873381 RepID=UPI001CA75E3B|nr:TetR/AcrR family transcriptional regulator [Nocardia coffeae]MBY8861966.1 TetR/AcrR family transcriptional regulator [Nocardia coffeae]